MSMGVLNVIGGADRGKRFDLTLPETRIGRGADQDVVLSDIAVSRRHITVLQEGPRYRLRDLGSGNGTLVNGQRIDTVLLNDGDHIELGNTVLRFNQQGMSASAGPPGYAPPPQPPVSAGGFGPPPTASNFGQGSFQPPSAQSFAPPAPSYSPPPQPAPAPYVPPTPMPVGPVGMPPVHGAATQAPQVIGVPTMGGYAPGTMAPTPSPLAQMPRAAMPRASAGRRAVSSGPLDTPLKMALAFGGMGLFFVVGVTVIVSRTVFAKPVVVASDAEESYKQGLRLFSQGDYEGAKINFSDAATQAPEAPEPKRYLKQCDAELRARGALKAAERSQAARRYLDAVRAAEQVDEGTLSYEQASRMKRELGVKAATEEVEDAKRSSETSAAQQRLQHALELDPNNAEARALLAKLKGGKPVAVAAVAPEPPPEKPERHHASTPAPPPPAVKEPKEPKTSTPNVSVGESKTAMALYKNKDFAGAVKAARVESMSQNPKQAEKTMALMNQLKAVQAAYERAGAEEQRSPAEAVKDYTEAMTLDQKLSHGIHAAFFKQKIGKVQLAAAQQAFQAGKYDQAYQSVLLAQKYGAGDGGMMKQLEAKAAELVQKGQALPKSSLQQAKQLWRMACKMVPTNSPIYAKAYGLINNSSGPARDEDEN
jgi:tetratricopeptide (TPR) repeat protein